MPSLSEQKLSLVVLVRFGLCHDRGTVPRKHVAGTFIGCIAQFIHDDIQPRALGRSASFSRSEVAVGMMRMNSCPAAPRSELRMLLPEPSNE